MATQLQTESKALLGRSFTPAPAGLLQRKCACGSHTMAGGECEECKKNRPGLQRKATNQSETSEVPPIVNEVLRSPGQSLNAATRAFMEPLFGYDFSQVRVHTDAKAAESARAVNALAYTVGQNVVFGPGQYASGTERGRHLLAHELTHTIQQSQSQAVNAPLLSAIQVSESDDIYEQEAEAQAERVMDGYDPAKPVQGQRRYGISRLQRSATSARVTAGGGEVPQAGTASAPTRSSLRPETCPPPADMLCPPAVDSPAAITNTFFFPLDSSSLNTRQRAEIDATAASWHAAYSSDTVRIDGYASAIGDCGYNWDLSCRRDQAIARELETPIDRSPGVPSGYIELFAHGESDEAGTALAPNQNATISIPTAPPTPPPPSPPSCAFPVGLGSARGCGSGPDFAHFDFPSISAASEAQLAVWATAGNLLSGKPPLPFRALVSDAYCMLEMDAVLRGLAGGAGHAAFSRFAAGTGGTETHGPASTLGSMAQVCGSFLATVARVKADIEAQLATQAASGVLNPCALSATPPATHFAFSDGTALKAVIGGTQGEDLFATGFTGSIPMRSYSIDLRFVICDDFGVDESDLYALGLFAFWVLQHERSATLYAPFINQLDLPMTVRGTF